MHHNLNSKSEKPFVDEGLVMSQHEMNKFNLKRFTKDMLAYLSDEDKKMKGKKIKEK